MPPPDAPREPGDVTLHVRRAQQGDARSLAWLVEHLSPLVAVQARLRLGRRLQGVYDADDIVGEAWFETIRRLHELEPREGRLAPVIVRFLGSTVVNKVNGLLRRHSRGRAVPLHGEGPAAAPEDLPAETTGVVTRAARRETARRIREAIGALEATDQEVLVLRLVDDLSSAQVADLLGLSPKAVAMRHLRACRRLRGVLPPGLARDLLGPPDTRAAS